MEERGGENDEKKAYREDLTHVWLTYMPCDQDTREDATAGHTKDSPMMVLIPAMLDSRLLLQL